MSTKSNTELRDKIRKAMAANPFKPGESIAANPDFIEQAVYEAQVDALYQLVVESQLSIWKELRKGEGFYVHGDGTIDVSMDYIDEKITELQSQLSSIGESK